jgi:hypothetical protein
VAGVPPHEELDKLAEAGHIEWGIWLYRCRRCRRWWEFDAWTYFPERSRLRPVRPVRSLARWKDEQRRALRPRSLPVAAALIFFAGLAVIGLFAGIAWLVTAFFSSDVAGWVVYSLVLGCLLFLYRMVPPSLDPEAVGRSPPQPTRGAAPAAGTDRIP